MSLCLALSTFPDRETAERVATTLVEARLAACVNLLPGVRSIYRWQGEVEATGEVLALFKTTQDSYPQFEEMLRELHPYDVPEIVALPVEQALGAYASWVTENVRP